MPFCLGIQYRNLTPSNEDSLPHLPGEAVPGVGSDLGLVFGLLSSVCILLMLDHKRCHLASSVPGHMFSLSGVEVL